MIVGKASLNSAGAGGGGGKIIKKKEKRNQQKQLQINKKKELKLNQKIFNQKSRKIGVAKNCVLVPLCPDLDLDSIISRSLISSYLEKCTPLEKGMGEKNLSEVVSGNTIMESSEMMETEDFSNSFKKHVVNNNNGMFILQAERFNQNIAFIPTERNLLSVLDATRVADMVLFVLSAEEPVDEFGESLMTAIKSQGVPNVICLVQVSLQKHLLDR